MNPPKHCRFCRHFTQFDEADKQRLYTEGLWYIAQFDGECKKTKGPELFEDTCNIWEQESP